MGTTLLDIHLWTARSDVVIDQCDNSCFSYHEKSEASLDSAHYQHERASFVESRNGLWTLRNKRPGRLKDLLKESEVCMVSFAALINNMSKVKFPKDVRPNLLKELCGTSTFVGILGVADKQRLCSSQMVEQEYYSGLQ